MTWLQEAAERAETKLRMFPRTSLGPSGRKLLDALDKEPPGEGAQRAPDPGIN